MTYKPQEPQSIWSVNKDLLQDQVDTIFNLLNMLTDNDRRLLTGAGNLLYTIWQQLEDGRSVHIVAGGERESGSGVYRPLIRGGASDRPDGGVRAESQEEYFGGTRRRTRNEYTDRPDGGPPAESQQEYFGK
jgi:hypothetical protein